MPETTTPTGYEALEAVADHELPAVLTALYWKLHDAVCDMQRYTAAYRAASVEAVSRFEPERQRAASRLMDQKVDREEPQTSAYASELADRIAAAFTPTSLP